MIDHCSETNSATPADGASETNSSLSSAARRALAEAKARRAGRKRADQSRPREIDGRQGPEPTRYGDWENNGIATDF